MSGINILSDSHFFTSLVELRGRTLINNIPITKEKQPGGVAHNKEKGTFFVVSILVHRTCGVKCFCLTPERKVPPMTHLEDAMTSTNSNLLKNLSLKIKDGNNETDTFSYITINAYTSICNFLRAIAFAII